jgi:hypothetical protein
LKYLNIFVIIYHLMTFFNWQNFVNVPIFILFNVSTTPHSIHSTPCINFILFNYKENIPYNFNHSPFIHYMHIIHTIHYI